MRSFLDKSQIPPCMGLFPPVRLLIFEILSQLRVTIALQDDILQSLIGKMLIFMPTYWLKLRLSVHKY